MHLFQASFAEIFEPRHDKTCLCHMRTTKMQMSLHIRGLISAFVVRCLDSIIPLVSISKISSVYLASVAAQAGLSLSWSETPKTGFLMMRLIYIAMEYAEKQTIYRATVKLLKSRTPENLL